MMGESGDLRYQALICACLPSARDVVTYDAALTSLRELANSKLHRFVSITSQVKLSSVIGYVEAIKRTRPPHFTESGDVAWQKKIKEHLELWCTAAPFDGKPVTGEAAAMWHMKQLTKKVGDDSVNFQDLRPIWSFQWLFDSAQRAQIVKWHETVFSDTVDPASSSASSELSSGAWMKRSVPQPSNKKSKIQKDDMHDLLVSLSM